VPETGGRAACRVVIKTRAGEVAHLCHRIISGSAPCTANSSNPSACARCADADTLPGCRRAETPGARLHDR
jgi:hypothetical protein